LLKYKFESFIDYYDYEECEKIMEEEDNLEMERRGSTGSDDGALKYTLGKSVTNSLDALARLMELNGGGLPV